MSRKVLRIESLPPLAYAEGGAASAIKRLSIDELVQIVDWVGPHEASKAFGLVCRSWWLCVAYAPSWVQCIQCKIERGSASSRVDADVATNQGIRDKFVSLSYARAKASAPVDADGAALTEELIPWQFEFLRSFSLNDSGDIVRWHRATNFVPMEWAPTIMQEVVTAVAAPPQKGSWLGGWLSPLKQAAKSMLGLSTPMIAVVGPNAHIFFRETLGVEDLIGQIMETHECTQNGVQYVAVTPRGDNDLPHSHEMNRQAENLVRSCAAVVVAVESASYWSSDRSEEKPAALALAATYNKPVAVVITCRSGFSFQVVDSHIKHCETLPAGVPWSVWDSAVIKKYPTLRKQLAGWLICSSRGDATV